MTQNPDDTSSTAVELPPEVRYSGPQTDEHRSAWLELYKIITRGGRWRHMIAPLNLLNDMAFGSRPLGELIPVGEDKSEIDRETKRLLEHVTAASSELAVSRHTHRPLHYDLRDGLVERWIDYRGE